MSTKVAILHSGGLDSTVCLLQAKASGHDVLSVGVDYQQRHKIEMEYARLQCASRGIERVVLSVSWTKAQREIPRGRSLSDMKSAVSTAFLTGRNVVFLSLAAAEAAGRGFDQLWLGINAQDYSGYPDCTPGFLNSFKAMYRIAAPGGPEIIAPLLDLTKPEIAAKALSLGLAKDETWSCYTPHLAEHGIEPCGTCDACRLNDYAWGTLSQ